MWTKDRGNFEGKDRDWKQGRNRVMNKILRGVILISILCSSQAIAVTSVQAAIPASTLHGQEFNPPDNGGPDITRGSGTR